MTNCQIRGLSTRSKKEAYGDCGKTLKVRPLQHLNSISSQSPQPVRPLLRVCCAWRPNTSHRSFRKHTHNEDSPVGVAAGRPCLDCRYCLAGGLAVALAELLCAATALTTSAFLLLSLSPQAVRMRGQHRALQLQPPLAVTPMASSQRAASPCCTSTCGQVRLAELVLTPRQHVLSFLKVCVSSSPSLLLL